MSSIWKEFGIEGVSEGDKETLLRDIDKRISELKRMMEVGVDHEHLRQFPQFFSQLSPRYLRKVVEASNKRGRLTLPCHRCGKHIADRIDHRNVVVDLGTGLVFGRMCWARIKKRQSIVTKRLVDGRIVESPKEEQVTAECTVTREQFQTLPENDTICGVNPRRCVVCSWSDVANKHLSCPKERVLGLAPPGKR